MLVPGHRGEHSRAPIPVINWYTTFAFEGSVATAGSQLPWCLYGVPAGRSSSNPPCAETGAERASAATSNTEAAIP